LADEKTPGAPIDYRRQPERYRIGRGEQGVLTVEPYKSELLPHWRFKTPALARNSVNVLLTKFDEYKAGNDFVGMDMTRKFLQMGYTRSRRYARHASGRKYAQGTRSELPLQEDPEKAESARIFYAAWQRVRDDPAYQDGKRRHQASQTKRKDSGQ
jgi:hypothetical protein